MNKKFLDYLKNKESNFTTRTPITKESVEELKTRIIKANQIGKSIKFIKNIFNDYKNKNSKWEEKHIDPIFKGNKIIVDQDYFFMLRTYRSETENKNDVTRSLPHKHPFIEGLCKKEKEFIFMNLIVKLSCKHCDKELEVNEMHKCITWEEK